jgi:Holliday junction resolvase-like predicted endonuclease
MTPRQCEIAAESYAACLLSRVGYDVSIQYGAHQPHYDLVAEKAKRFLPISVKGSQDGGWMLAVRYKNKDRSYHEAADHWLAAQRTDVIFMLVQFESVSMGEAPREYIATPNEIATQLKSRRGGKGNLALQEGWAPRKRSKYNHEIPAKWIFNEQRVSDLAV